MATLARESGARSFFPSKVRDLASVYSAIAEELASLYVLGMRRAMRGTDPIGPSGSRS